ncbi:dolichyl-phosphate-mannose--protein mannosyltransferase [Plantibacter sp. Mn2098]|uniref:dolichyl-phosphate-mannose--protein mannosyltransferase n=1 Tax=Plantibacter sp. Mn2098 TaxID=3395266 RepID=UPI003BEDBE0D
MSDDLLEAPVTGSRLDRRWARFLSVGRRRTLWTWGGPIAVTLLAAILRFWNLGHPHSLVFDETFYVKDAWSLWNNGYESTWPDGADKLFASGDAGGFSTVASYVVHPPLGKWLIGLGMAAFGVDNSFGWRVSTAIAGTLAVLLIVLIAKRLFASTALAVIAGFLFAIDGHAIVMSRVSLLDNFLMFFVLLGFGAVLLDRPWHASRLAAKLAEARASGRDPAWGPVLWFRPWLLAAGLAFGAATAVKWNGLYFIAGFGLYVIVTDMLLRRKLGLTFWGSAAILKQGPATFLNLVPPAFVVYLASWSGWIFTSGGYDRQWANQEGNAWTGAFSWVPHWVQSLIQFHQSAYSFHIGLHTPHPYQANPLTWLFMIRPTSMYYESPKTGTDGCVWDNCSSAITSIGNPLIWWGAAIALGYLIYRLVRYREWQVGIIVLGVAAGYLPWMLYLNRTVFQFYTISFEPFLILGLAYALGKILGSRDDLEERRVAGVGVVGVYLVIASALSVFWYPLWTATTVPYWYWYLHAWLPSWV